MTMDYENNDDLEAFEEDEVFVFRASYSQQRLWFLDQLKPGNTEYNVANAVRLTGQLDAACLERALGEIVQRHEVLRTTFETIDGELMQVVVPSLHVPLVFVDLMDVPLEQREAQMMALANEEAQVPFDLLHGPLIRTALLRVEEEEHLLLLTMHHIVCDGWSMGIYFHELATLYHAYKAGMESPLTDLQLQFADFTHWQLEWLQGDVMEQQLAYWKGQLGGELPVVQVPTDRPRPAVQTNNGDFLLMSVRQPLFARLLELSQREGVTLFMTLRAAFDVFLQRYTGLTDLPVGMPIAGRNRSEVESIIGFFVNTLVLRTDLSGNPTFRDLLQRVRRVALDAYGHQDVPFEKLVEELQPDRNLSHPPLFQIMFGLQPAPMKSMELPGMMLESVETFSGRVAFDLSVSFIESPEELLGKAYYNTDLFDEATIARMMGHFYRLLEAVVEDVSVPISELPMMSAEEREQVLVDWNRSDVAHPEDVCLHEMFEAQVARTPELVAVEFEGAVLTYRELNERADRLASALQKMGVGPNGIVGIYMERSLDMIVAELGVLKSGGAFVPLDPGLPGERVAFMLEDTAARVVLTQERLLSEVPLGSAQVIAVDAVAFDEEAFVTRSVTPDDMAYIIYTSGSTGRPKGVMIPHRAISNRMFWAMRVFPMTEDESLLQKTPFGFDVSITDIYLPLLTGARLVMAVPGGHQDSEYLVRAVAEHNINVLQVVPTQLQMLLGQEGVEACKSLRLVICGGDVLPPELVEPFYQKLPHARLINLYGPTEATIETTTWECKPGLDARTVPIGLPVDNARVYLLDEHLQPVPVGVAGELHIGGKGLALGYLNRPDLTEEKFIADPFAEEPGARMYKTGDLARYRPDGVIEYLGRIDHQVKVRGYRIELGEIEALLQEQPGVSEAVVIAREDVPGDQRLVAYVIGEAEGSELRARLREKLPEYMVPSAYVFMEQWPLNVNGKIDRRALPAPDGTQDAVSVKERAYVEPRTDEEQQVAAIFADVLRAERVGVYDSFFELGGHSLLATQLRSRLNEALGVNLPLRALFERPTVESLVRHAAELRQEEQGAGVPAMPAIVPVAREGARLPLSYAQERLWFFEQFHPGTGLFNIPSAVRMTGRLELDALQKSFEVLVKRHEVLRTTFATAEGQPVQRVAAHMEVPLEVADVRGASRSEVEQLAVAEAGVPFDLEKGPLLRTKLLRVDEQEHVLLFTMHHIISDGWSMGIFIRELAAQYNAFAKGEESVLAPLPVQYADYAHWQKEWLQGEVLDAQMQYWREQLGGELPVMQVPTDRPRPAVQTFNGATESFVLPKELGAKLKTLSQAQGATLFMTLLAAFNVLMQRYTGQSDVVVGTPIAGRNRAETEALIGFFVNMLVMRSDLSGDPTFADLIGRVRETALGAYAHQDVPFEKLVEELQPVREMSHSPLFQVLFILQNAPMESLELDGLTLTMVESEGKVAKYDLTLSLAETEAGISGVFEYNVDLFDATTIRRMRGHFERLLAGVVAEPERRVSQVPMLTDGERGQVLEAWNETAHVFEGPACVHQLVEEQAQRTPERVAVMFGDESLTYRELDAQANQLAHRLQRYGVGPDVLVGIALERSLDMVVALLGVLKTGGAYVPLDPQYPQDRLLFMAEDAALALILTEEAVAGKFAGATVELLCLDAERESMLQESEEKVEVAVQGDHLAYVIYTSGSTGLPKGVLIEHRGVVNFLQSTREQLGMTAQDVMLAVTTLSFDIAVMEIYLTLMIGAKLVVAPREAVLDGKELAALLTTSGATVMQATPVTWRMLLDAGWQGERSLKVLSGGEAMTRELEATLVAGCSSLWNFYGPTETTVYSSVTELRADGPITVGRPIANTQMYVLDANLQPVPIGVPGELHIGGDGVARGYLNRDALTAEKFIPNPFLPEQRIYKTGDLARFLPDGRIEHLGRMDHQVKVRGFRIELGEIEALLDQHAAVSKAVAVVREDHPGDQRIVAYVTLKAEGQFEFRQYLKGHLPEYMVPSAIVVLDEFPLTPNAKIDRRALPKPDGQVHENREFVAPRTPNEELLAGLFAEVLRVKQVGANDHFFELGGHSLLATQVMSRVRESFGVELPLRTLFQSPTVAGLSAEIERAMQEEKGTVAQPIVPVARAGQMPLSFAQQRLWFLDRLEPGNPAYNIPLAVRLQGVLDEQALKRTLAEMVNRHEALRTVFAEADGQPMQVVVEEMDGSALLTVLQASSEEETEQLIRTEATRSFDLQNGPLFRALLICRGDVEHILMLNMHHIISDGWSLGVMLQEFAALYTSFAKGEEAALEPLPVQYADFAHWQQEWLQGDVLETQLGYWKEQLAGELPVLQLPTDRPRPAVQSYRGASRTAKLPHELTQALKTISQREGTTLFMTLLTAFKTLLHRYTGQEDVRVGTPIAGRNRREIEGLVGFFVNTLVLRSDLSGNLSFRELLGQVREMTLGAYAHQDLPFEKLVEELQPERNLNHSPLFQVMFVLQNAPMSAIELPELTCQPVPMESDVAKFDLTLSITESADGLHVMMEYSTDLFEDATIQRMLGHFATLLQAVIDDPGKRVSELCYLSEAERHQVLVEWNDTDAYFPSNTCIHHLIEAQVEKTPDAVAIDFYNQRLTYRELNDRANQLARHLQTRGVGPDVLVGLCVDRSPEMIVGLLGILKAGGAYVPLDPATPSERMDYLLRDSQVSLLLTQQHLLDTLPKTGVSCLCLDTEWDAIAQESTENVLSDATADNLAYVIYTSGSTGKPKGVLLEHRGLCNTAMQYSTIYGIHEKSRVLQFASFNFDASVVEVFSTLTTGASLVLATREDLMPGPTMIRLLQEKEVTFAALTPSVWAVLPDAELSTFETVASAGEALSPDLVARLGVGRRLINGYGPTEATVGVTYAECRADEPVTIGRPIPNGRVYLLDAYQNPVPVGVPGEICIGGVGLARGYLNRPDLTAEKFILNPFANDGSRLYRSGDVGRYLPDGRIEYMGRIDNQVKIRGYRVELGEIETVLKGHPSVREAAVLASNERLVAYVATNEEDAKEREVLRNYLQEKLPDYMVPAIYVFLDTLPLTLNGKVDHRKLPEPDDTASDRETAIVPPRDLLELQLVQLFEELLQVKPIGIRDNFFTLGGHSLLAVRLVTQIKQRFGQEVPLASLFQGGTIEQLADLLRQGEQNMQNTQDSPLIKVQPQGSKTPFFCVHPIGGSVFAYLELARALGEEQPFYGLQARGLDDGQQPLESIEDMAATYIEAIRVVQPQGPYQLGGWSMGGVIAYEMAQQLRKAGEDVACLTLFDSRVPQGEVVDERSLFAAFLVDLAGVHGGSLPEYHADLESEEGRERLLTLVSEQSQLAGGISAEQLRRLYRVFRANLMALQGYEMMSSPQDVLLFQAEEERAVYGWEQWTTGTLDVQKVAGNHYTMLRMPHVLALAERLDLAKRMPL